MQELAGVVNHNAGLLEKFLDEGFYVHRQVEPSISWPIHHDLGSFRPLIETYDSNGNRIGHAVNRQTQTHCYSEILFAIPMSGTAILRF
jgi:hypothetical protein